MAGANTDRFTVGHFVMGLFAILVLLPYARDGPLLLFTVNCLHFVSKEFVEIKSLHGKALEPQSKRIVDHLAFLLGSLLGLFVIAPRRDPASYSPAARQLMALLLVAFSLHQFGREMFPATWPVDSVYHPAGWKAWPYANGEAAPSATPTPLK